MLTRRPLAALRLKDVKERSRPRLFACPAFLFFVPLGSLAVPEAEPEHRFPLLPYLLAAMLGSL